MIDPVDTFAGSYAEARAKFLAAAAGLELQSHPEPLRGRELEPLAMDVARLGPADADALLVVSGGCHGVEGHCGSGVQVAALHDAALRERAREAGVALLFVHALNPWGFSTGRRVTHEGVDLNRNFIDFRQPRPRNIGYDQLAAAVLPQAWPPGPAEEAAIQAYAGAHGMAALQQAVAGGQYHHPDGLFYGGEAPTWSQATLRMVLRQHGSRCRRLGWIDLHSGLGETGVAERIFSCRDDAAARQRAKSWWGPRDVTFTEDGTSSSSQLQGNAWLAAYDECPQATYTGITLEFGTRPLPVVTDALRFDHWVARRRDPADPLLELARDRMLHAFFVDTPSWKRAVVKQGLEAVALAIEGLAVRG
jgi:hypothetical protein